MKKAITQLISIILVAIISVGCGFGGALLAMRLDNSDSVVGRLVSQVANSAVKKEDAGNTSQRQEAEVKAASPQASMSINVSDDITIAEAVAAKVLPSVVGISTKYTRSFSGSSIFDFGFGFRNPGTFDQEVEGIGTGVIVDDSGFILTNSHVINDGDYNSITVSLYDGQEVEGSVIWNEKTLDLAVIKISAEGLTAAELGDSDIVRIGSYAAAIGNPLGLDFERSMSQGIISGLSRTITVSDSSTGSSVTMEGLLQTDATINSGNSGGPLLNSKGQVIGINTAKAGNGEGMGFAIPINEAKPIVEQIMKTGTFARPYLGISGISLDVQTGYNDAQLEEMFGVSQGIYVSSVAKGGGAETAGILSGDIIVEVEGRTITSMNTLNKLLVTYSAGDSIVVKVMREGESLEFNVTLTDGNISF